jgi:bla regulator protein BlaR1
MTLAAWVVGALISNLLVASVLGFVAWRVSRRGRHPALAHALWVLVLVKLVTPPVVDLPVLPQAMDPTALVDALEGDWFPRALDGVAASAAVPEPVRVADGTAAGAFEAQSSPSPLVLLVATLASAWALGALISLVRTGLQRRRLATLFAQAATPPESTRRRADELAGRLGLPAAPPVRVVGASISPLLWSGAGRARIVLPAELLDDLPPAQLDALLLHELAHFARRDHWVRLAELAVGALYWWFPPVSWARRQLREVEEQCCDAWVVAARPEGARDYAEALLGTLAFLERGRSNPHSSVATAAVTTNELTRRLTMIMERHGAPRLSPGARLAALVLAVVVLPAAPTVIADEAVQDPASPPATPQVQDVTAFTQPPAPVAEPIQVADASADDERAAKKAAKLAARDAKKQEKKAARAAKKEGKADASAQAGRAKKGQAAADAKVGKKAKAAGDAKVAKKAKAAGDAKVAKKAKAAGDAKVAKKARAAGDAKVAKKAKNAANAKAAKTDKGAADAKAARKNKGAGDAKAGKKAKSAADAKSAKKAKAAGDAKAAKQAKSAAKAKAAKKARSAAGAKPSPKGKAAAKAKAAKESKSAQKAKPGAKAKAARNQADKKGEAKAAKKKADAKAAKTKAKAKAAKKEAAAEARAQKKAASKAERAAKKAEHRAGDEPVDAMLQDA